MSSAATDTARTPRRRTASTGRWFRVIHAYTSLGSMLIVAFFALTGLTLNHPSWTIGGTSTTKHVGTLPVDAVAGTTVDYLAISEYARNHLGVGGEVTDHGLDGDVGHIDYAGPGSSARVTFSITSSTVDATVTQGDLLAVMNDVHKGRNTTSSWGWVIDASAIALLVVTVTGLGIQLFQRKRRRSGLITTAALGLVGIVAIWMAST